MQPLCGYSTMLHRLYNLAGCRASPSCNQASRSCWMPARLTTTGGGATKRLQRARDSRNRETASNHGKTTARRRRRTSPRAAVTLRQARDWRGQPVVGSLGAPDVGRTNRSWAVLNHQTHEHMKNGENCSPSNRHSTLAFRYYSEYVSKGHRDFTAVHRSSSTPSKLGARMSYDNIH